MDYPMTFFDNIIIIGVGLLGGSIGLAVKERSLARTVFGVDSSLDSQTEALQCACADKVFSTLQELPNIEGTTLGIVCVPVGSIVPVIQELTERFAKKSDLLITDTGSTKQYITAAVTDERFVASHPIAGSEQSGPAAARSNLFEGRLTAVCFDGEAKNDERFETIETFWQALGSRTAKMEAAEHDRIFAATSHLPHLISFALANYLKPDERDYTGTGYADMTRLAASNPEVWNDIFRTNTENLLEALHRFETELHLLRDKFASPAFQKGA
jgi:prephenate dehydrogenase